MRVVPITLIALTASLCSAAEFVVLDGDRQAVIVYETGAAAEAEKAWQDMVKYLKLSTGRDYVAVPEGE